MGGGEMRIDPSQADYLDFISEYVDLELKEQIWPINVTIHDNPELCYHEYHAHDTLTAFLKAHEGWKVTSSAYGIDTAFVAEFDSGRDGPVVSFNAEYDALAGIGHACGHNLIATASVSAALASAATMSRYALPGKIVLFGTPAEEGGGGKIKLLDAGAFKNHKVDVSLMGHPGNVIDGALVKSAAEQSFKVEYFGKEAHAAWNPWDGINALDALISAYTSLSILRQQTRPGCLIHGHITDGGIAPNVIHAYAAGVFTVRARTQSDLDELYEKVESCFKAGATATGATLKITKHIGYQDHVPNRTLGKSYRHFFNRLGGAIPEPDEDVKNGTIGASTDQGNVSHVLPSLHSSFLVKCDFNCHNPGFTKAAAGKDAFEAALRVAKALAATGVEVLAKEGLKEEIWREWTEAMGRHI